MAIGSDLVARSLREHGVDAFFFVMGGPMIAVERACLDSGMRGVDVRHEQAGAMMAQAYGRLRGQPGVCMGCSGPGTTNLVTGVANAWADGAPLVALGGSSPVKSFGRGAFQEMDQVAMMAPITRWSERVYDAERIPEYLARAFRIASGLAGTPPGPVYLDLPGDVLYAEADEEDCWFPNPLEQRLRPSADHDEIVRAVDQLEAASRPILLAGSGVLWSDAASEVQQLVERVGMPVFTTPQGRGVIPEDHEYSLLGARSKAFKEADLLLVVGTRGNYVFSHMSPPRFSEEARVINVNVDPLDLECTRQADVRLVADAKRACEQLVEELDGRASEPKSRVWIDELREVHEARQESTKQLLESDDQPIHPLRLCNEVSKVVDRDAVIVIDGQEILNYGRQSIPTFLPGHRLNSGVFGTMGVGLPFGVGAALAKPDTQVVVVHGDGSLGMNFMELDTAARHDIPVKVVVSLNGGWTADPQGVKPGRDLGYTRYHEMAGALGCHSEFVEDPSDLQSALERALAFDGPALVNVVTDHMARAGTTKFTSFST